MKHKKTDNEYNCVELTTIKELPQFISGIAMYLEEAHGMDIPPNKLWHCRLLMFDFFWAFLFSAYILIAVTFERFYSIIRPHKAASFNTVKRARRIIISLCLLSFCYLIPFLLVGSTNATEYVPNKYASDNGIGEMYYWLTDILTFFIPFIFLLIMNSVIIYTLKNRSKVNLQYLQSKVKVKLKVKISKLRIKRNRLPSPSSL